MSQRDNRGRGGSRGRGGYRGGRPSGPQLPADLLAKVDPGAPNRNRGRPRGAGSYNAQRPGPRREEVRASLKQFNNAHRSTEVAPPRPDPAVSRPAPPRAKRPTADALADEPPRKKKKKPELSLPGEKVDDAEDGEIAWLEYMLKKEKAKESGDLDDGLDELLGFADVIGPGGQGLPMDADSEGSEQELELSEDGEESDEESDAGEDLDVEDPDDEDESASDREEGSEADVDEASVEGPAADPQAISPGRAAESAEASSSGTRYVPPHIRAAELEAKSRGDKAKELERVKLERRAQGILNKLSEANMETMLAEIEKLYRDHSRHDVSTILTDLIINTIANRSNLLNSFVILYATLVGALHRILGTEFGAHFIHATLLRYRSSETSADADLAATIYETPDASKSPLNLLTLIAELYNAEVIGANLIYDLIRSFLTESAPEEAVMGEGQVESLLRLLKCSGQQLRSDDPASLKDIVNLVQDKTKGKEKTMTTRARYMIETLVDLKGGKSKSTQNSDADAVRMKKFLTGLSRKRRVATTEPLRVSLADLLSADTRGKWWLVGAGWSGNPLVEREVATAKVGKSKPKKAVEDEEVLLEAARSQGMNTDVRRSVFVILMTSEDYIHACDRLSLLKFTETQQREFVRVALHCAGTEKMYNPYHALIINHLCSESYSHRFTLQYALWDFLRELGDDSGKAARTKCGNVAQTVAYIVGRRALDLTVFKAVDFTSLKPAGVSFFSTFLSRLILATQTASPLFTLPKSFKMENLDLEALEETFEKALTNFELAQGLAWALKKKSTSSQDDLSEVARAVVKQGSKVGLDILSRAV